MRTITSIALLAVTVGFAGPVTATTVLQWGFDATSGAVSTPVNDDSGAPLHPGSNLIHGGSAPVYSADIPSASVTQYVTGIGSVDFTGTPAAISTANSGGVGSGQGIIAGSDVFNAGGLTMEVWIKNPSGAAGFAMTIGGVYNLGISSGRVGFFRVEGVEN